MTSVMLLLVEVHENVSCLVPMSSSSSCDGRLFSSDVFTPQAAFVDLTPISINRLNLHIRLCLTCAKSESWQCSEYPGASITFSTCDSLVATFTLKSSYYHDYLCTKHHPAHRLIGTQVEDTNHIDRRITTLTLHILVIDSILTLDVMDRKILVIGATGRQGKALIRSLQPTRNVPSNFQILALSRNLASPSAAALKAFPNVQLVEGDLNRPETVRKIFDDAGGKACMWGMFVALPSGGSRKTRKMEEQQGMMLANLALEYEVVHFVYSSVERGGESDDDDPSMVGRIAKVRIERYIKSLGKKGLNWTIVRPVLFMEDIKSVFGRTSLAVLRCVMKPDVKIEIVALDDVGRLVAAVFKNPGKCTHKIFVATSDILSVTEMDAAYIRATGCRRFSLPRFVGRLLLATNKSLRSFLEDCDRICHIRSANPDGYDAHLKDAQELLPEMTSYESYVRQSLSSRKLGEASRNWVTLFRTGP